MYINDYGHKICFYIRNKQDKAIIDLHGATVICMIKRKGKETHEMECEIKDAAKGLVCINVPEGILNTRGKLEFQARVEDETKRITSSPAIFMVE